MRLTLYFARYYVAVTALILSVLVMFVVSVTMIENAGELTRLTQAWTTIFYLASFGAVEYAYDMMPVASFIGLLVTGTMLTQRGEILATQAAALGPRHTWKPFVATAMWLAALTFLGGEWVLPNAIAKRHSILKAQMQQADALTQFYDRRLHWFFEHNWLLYLPHVDLQQQVFAKPLVYQLKDGLIMQAIESSALHHDQDSGWWLEDAYNHSMTTAEIVYTERLQLPLQVSPRDLIDVTGSPREMTTPQVAKLIVRREHGGFDTTAHRIELHQRFALPLSSICLVLAALPWALHPTRDRSLASTLGFGVLVVALKLSISHLCRLVALAHKIPAPIGAWGPMLFCLALIVPSIWLYKRRMIF